MENEVKKSNFTFFIPFVLSRQFDMSRDESNPTARTRMRLRSDNSFYANNQPTDKDKPDKSIAILVFSFPFSFPPCRYVDLKSRGRAYSKYCRDCLWYASFFPIGIVSFSIRPLLSCEASRPALPFTLRSIGALSCPPQSSAVLGTQECTSSFPFIDSACLPSVYLLQNE